MTIEIEDYQLDILIDALDLVLAEDEDTTEDTRETTKLRRILCEYANLRDQQVRLGLQANC